MTDGISAALDLARDAAGELDVRIGGGPNVIRQYLMAGLIDEIHVAIAPVVLGSGEQLFEGIDMLSLGYEVTRNVSTAQALHVIIEKS